MSLTTVSGILSCRISITLCNGLWNKWNVSLCSDINYALLYTNIARNSISDSFQWQCPTWKCKKYFQGLGINTGSQMEAEPLYLVFHFFTLKRHFNSILQSETPHIKHIMCWIYCPVLASARYETFWIFLIFSPLFLRGDLFV